MGGASPPVPAEHYDGKVRRLRLFLTKQGCLSQGEQNQFLNHTHPPHGSGLLFGYAADGFAYPDWLIVTDTSQPGAWRLKARSTCPVRVTGTRSAFAFLLIWPLCSAL